MVKANFVYELPVGPGKHYLNHGIAARVIGGWRLSGIGRRETGIRYTATFSTPPRATNFVRAGPTC